MELRDYQHDSINEVRASLRHHKRTILCAPTGAGKSVIAAFMIKASIAKGKRVAIICHRIEILGQFLRILKDIGVDPYIVYGDSRLEFGHQVYLSMLETWDRRTKGEEVLNKLGVDVIYLDEIHWAGYKKIIDRFNGYVIGITATPKSSGTVPLNQYFDTIVAPVQVAHLIKEGYLVPAITYGPDLIGKLKIKGKDFSEKDLMKEFKKPTLYRGALDNYIRHSMGEKAVCYNVNVEHSLETTQQFIDAGIPAWHVDANTDKDERKRIFEQFTERDDGVLCNVGIATTGWDEPTIRTVILNRATSQLTLKVQMDGRGARQCPDIGKKHFKVIDMGNNYLRHGEFGEFIDWVSIFNKPSEDKTSKESKRSIVKKCKECDAIIKNILTECPYCGCSYTEEEILQHVLDNASTEEIKEYRMKHLPPHLRGVKLSSMSYGELIDYGHHMGYNEKWARVKYQIFKKYKTK